MTHKMTLKAFLALLKDKPATIEEIEADNPGHTLLFDDNYVYLISSSEERKRSIWG